MSDTAGSGSGVFATAPAAFGGLPSVYRPLIDHHDSALG